MTIAPGSYLRDMREADGKTVRDVAQILRMLKLTGQGRVWPASQGLEQLLIDIEGGHRAPSDDQLRSLTIVYPFLLAHFRDLVRLRLLEVANG